MSDPFVDEIRPPWTCPFCPLLCDGLTLRRGAGSVEGWSAIEGRCRHVGRLASFDAEPSDAQPAIDGVPCSLDDAVAAASALLAASRQPLFGGLAIDVSGARALYRLACRTGAIYDAVGGDAAQHVVRARQDRGGWFTTLAEMRTRADVVVCLGGVAESQGIEFFDRIGVGEPVVASRHVVVIGPVEGDAEAIASLVAREGVTVENIALAGDAFDAIGCLSAIVAGRTLDHAPPSLVALAGRLKAARYAVIVGAGERLPAQGSLIVEAVHQVVATLNRSTRAAAFWIGGGNGAGTAGEVFTWLSGLPLRSRAGPRGLEHEPVCFDAARSIRDGAVDVGLWVSAFDDSSPPPTSAMPWIVVGPPALASSFASSSASPAPAVFIPVSTPGIGSRGHLFRGDGGVVLPLTPLYVDRLPGVADVVARIGLAMESA